MRLFAPVLAVLICCGALSAAPLSWEYRDGRWQQIDAPATQPAPEPTLDRVEQLIEQQQDTAARNLAIRWLKANPDSPARDRALLLVSQALYQYGDRIKAFYYLDELMDTYPESPLFYRALELQYTIADAFLRGYKTRFLLIPMFTAKSQAVEMLYRIQQRAPGSPLAETALRRTADHYYDQREYDLAADAYAAYARAYPRSPDLPLIRLRQAFSSLSQFRGIRFDATALIDARAQLRDMVAAYPELAARENLPSVIQRIDETFAAKLYDRADYYVRTRDPRAAAYHFMFLMQTYPHSRYAARAQRRLDQLPDWAKENIDPAITGGYEPSLPSSSLEMR